MLGVAMLAVQKLFVERRQFQMESGRAPLPLAIHGPRAISAAAGVVIVVALSLLPAIVALVTAFTPARGPVLSYGGFTLEHTATALPKARPPFWDSLGLAALPPPAGGVFS